MYDVIIIGAGPAGISASLYAIRANLKVLVLYEGISNLEKAHQVDNYYGFEDGITGKELYESGIRQAKNLGVEFKKIEVTGIEYLSEGYNVKTPLKNYESKTVIIATGDKKIAPKIKGVQEFEGKGISYCAICDAFFYKSKNVAIIGNGEFAMSEALTLSNVTDKIVILTNGDSPKFENDKFEVIETEIQEVQGIEKVQAITFKDGNKIDIDGIFIAMGEAGATDFAKILGIMTEETNIKVNGNMETNVPGIYACGNITGGLLQISKAVYEGAQAGLSAVKYIKGGK